MLSPIKLIDIELSQPLETVEDLHGYIKLQGLVRLHGTPIGYIQAPISAGHCEAATLGKLILEQHSWKIIRELLCNGLATPSRPGNLQLEDLFDVPPPSTSTGKSLPLVTVAICTRDRSTELAKCLDALNHLDYPSLEILVVDNAPSNDATEQLVRASYPNVRYTREPRPGLNWARNRAIIEANGEVIAYTDDDVIIDPGWVNALASVFAEAPEVMAVTGLVVPYELETDAQVLFEMHGGFGKGFDRKWFKFEKGKRLPKEVLGGAQFGVGANMAYRRSVFNQIGYFDPALDVGTVTQGGGDLEMFFRVLKEGHMLVYEPKAIVRHRHRREYEKLKSQLTNNCIGFIASCVRTISAYPDELATFLQQVNSWLWSWHWKKLDTALMKPSLYPRELVWADFVGCVIGLTRYQKSRKIAAQIAQTYGPLPPLPQPTGVTTGSVAVTPEEPDAIAIRTIELTQPIEPITDIDGYSRVRVFTTWNSSPIGTMDIPSQHQNISVPRLHDEIVDSIRLRLIDPNGNSDEGTRWNQSRELLKEHYLPTSTALQALVPAQLPPSVAVSIVVGTFDRPDDLHRCLRCLTAQQASRRYEIIVVDNHPVSGLTPPIVSKFPEVTLVKESRQGAAYARNAGVVASSGDIVITVDDDIQVPSNWLEKLVSPFVRDDVMIVAGNVLPVELETTSQRLFEQYGEGGLGRGFDRFEVGKDWFESFGKESVIPIWELGGTANAAFRASIFHHPQIGLMEETLGPGMPSGVGEDMYLFYKVLKAGYTIVYEPTACAWHTHRRTMAALHRQLYNYSKGYSSYQLTTLLKDHDLRVVKNLLLDIPKWHVGRIQKRFQRQSDHSIPLILLEMRGHIAGPWSLWQSYKLVKKQGRSGPYLPAFQRFGRRQEVEIESQELAKQPVTAEL